MARFLQDAKWSLQLGYRLEAVDDAAFAKDALASTLRTVLTLDTAGHRASDANGFGVLLQVEDTSVLGNDRSFANAGSGSSANGVEDRPVVADPEQTSLLQARLEHRSVAGAFSLGRMALTHGDQRFLGPVGWRQHHQTFDAARWLSPTWKWGPSSWQLDAAHLDRVHRITTAREPMSSQVAQLTGTTSVGQVRLFAYLLDYERSAIETLSSRTLGAHWSGKHPIADQQWELLWDVQWARQSDFGENPRDFEVDFLRAELGAAVGSVSLRLGQETLEGNGSVAFQTPLATLHKFNGWADQFLSTPREGLEDRYLRLDWDRGRLAASVRAHVFEADASARDYGSELDASLIYRVASRHPVGIKLARYQADDFSRDVDKAMVFATWSWSR